MTEHAEYLAGDGQGEQSLTLSITEFELFRFLMGRRSAAQLAAMDWSADPSAVLGQLTVFGRPPPTSWSNRPVLKLPRSRTAAGASLSTRRVRLDRPEPPSGKPPAVDLK